MNKDIKITDDFVRSVEETLRELVMERDVDEAMEARVDLYRKYRGD